jgi:hypothetical protein
MHDIRKHETVRYFVSAAGRIVPAPDNRVTAEQCGFSGWQTCDAQGAKEIETLSIRLSRQRFEDQKALSAEQQLREKTFRERLKANARIRIAMNYSANDVEYNQRMLRRMEDQERMQELAILAQFDPTSKTSGFELEIKEASPPTKREGIAA